MKILAFTDTHGDMALMRSLKKKASEADLVICGGDMTIFNDHLQKTFALMDSFPVPVVFIHGNHESKDDIKELMPKYKNLHYIHNRFIRIRKLLIFGYGDGGFSARDRAFERISRSWSRRIHPEDRVILLTHAPPINTTVDDLEGHHAGVKSIRVFIQKNPVAINICGHLHECEQRTDFIGDCLVMNPGMGALIELEKEISFTFI